MLNVKIIADSISTYSKVRITTFELEYHRFILSEVNTHRLFSRNSASSRAIPVPKMLEIVRTDPAIPLFFGKNRPGMQAIEEVDSPDEAEAVWRRMAQQAADGVEELHNLGVHKQIANRPLEPYQYIRTVLTATDFNNWYWLRDHTDAQPEIQAPARLMLAAHEKSKPQRLNPGEWHVPYVNCRINKETNAQMFFDENNKRVSLHEALMISASCCAQVSYRKTDGSLEKAETVYKRLVESKPCHASPTEHQAMVIGDDRAIPGITHYNTRDMSPGSGNLRWWLQYRQLIKDNVRYN